MVRTRPVRNWAIFHDLPASQRYLWWAAKPETPGAIALLGSRHGRHCDRFFRLIAYGRWFTGDIGERNRWACANRVGRLSGRRPYNDLAVIGGPKAAQLTGAGTTPARGVHITQDTSDRNKNNDGRSHGGQPSEPRGEIHNRVHWADVFNEVSRLSCSLRNDAFKSCRNSVAWTDWTSR